MRVENLLNVDSQDPFVEQLERSLKKIFGGKRKKVSKLLVALSGGPDSTALLVAIKHIAESKKIKIFACHVNHNLRGQDSEDDEKFCRDLCQKLKVDLTVKHLNKSIKHASEEYLREMRYQFLKEVCSELKCNYLATGHTVDDQVETFLFRLFRGTSPTGLIGMESTRKIDKNIALVRPMLAISKKEVESFLNRIDIEPRLDKSNLDLSYARNYLRHGVIPAIELKFPGFAKRVEQLRQLFKDNESLLAPVVEEELEDLEAKNKNHWKRSAFTKKSKALRRRLISKAMQERKIETNFARVGEIIDLIDSSSGAISLNENWDIRVKKNEIIWLKKTTKSNCKENQNFIEEEIKIPGLNTIASLNCVVKVTSFESQKPQKIKFPLPESSQAFVDLNLCEMPLVVRLRKPADVIKPFGMKTLVKLKKYLHTHNTKNALSFDEKTVVVSDQQEIIWVPGVGLSEKIRVDKCPTHIIEILKISREE